MADAILNAIQTRQLNTGNISFDEIKRLAARDNDCWNQLGRGRAILTSTAELDQYLYSYGPMTKGQWNTFLGSASLPDDRNVRMVAYGCGQGLAASLLFDGFGTALRSQTRQVVLIESSVVALARARAVVGTYCPDAAVHDINKELDDIKSEELRLSHDDASIHIFSNVLDIPSFDHGALFGKMFSTSGQHIVLAVSHDRDFNGGANRLRSLESAVRDARHKNWLRIQSSSIGEFDCPNGMPAVSWDLRLEVCT